MKLLILVLCVFMMNFCIFSQSDIIDDGMNGKLIFSEIPKRIVSTSPSNTEILFAIGVGKNIVGVTNFCNYPKEAKDIEKIGGLNLNIEKIISLEPDIIIGSEGMGEKTLLKLRKLGKKVIILRLHNFKDIIDTIKKFGKMFNNTEKTDKLAYSMMKRYLRIRDLVPKLSKRKKVYFEIYSKPAMSANGKTFIGDIIRRAGGINIASGLSINYPKISDEFILKNSPNYVFFTYPHSGNSYRKIIEILKNNKTKIVKLTGDEFVRPGPRVIDAIEEIYNILYRNVH